MELTIAEKIEVLRKRRGLSVGEFAEKLGKTRQNIANKLKRNNFSDQELQEIAKALDCTYTAVFTMNDTQETL